MAAFRILGFLCLFTIFFSVPAFAQTESSHISTFHSDYGLKLLKEGNSRQAVDQFIQALLFAPSNKTAQENLLSLAQKTEWESKSVRMQLFRFVELTDYTAFLKEQLQGLEKENTASLQFLFEETNASDPHQVQIREIRNQIEKRKRPILGYWDEEFRNENDRAARLAKINQHLLEIKENLLEQFSFTSAVYERLNLIKSEIAKSVADDQRRQLAERYEDQLRAAKREVQRRDRHLKRQETRMRLLQKNLATVKSDFEYLQAKMQGTNQKIAELTGKLAGMSLQAYEKEAQLANKSSVSEKLQADLQDARQRWELVEKIIQEKDNQIKRLQEKSGEPFAAGNDPKMDSLQDSLAALQKKMETQEQSNRQTIASLRTEFALLKEDYARLNTASQQKDTMIGRLKNEVTARNRKLADIAEFFDDYDKDIGELNGIVEIYRGKLSAAHALLTDKDMKLENLEKEIAELQDKFGKWQQTNNSYPQTIINAFPERAVLQRMKNDLGALQGQLFEMRMQDGDLK